MMAALRKGSLYRLQRATQGPSDGIRALLTSLRRKKGQLLRRLGQRAFDLLSERGTLDLHDPETRALVDELHKSQRDLLVVEERLRSLEVSTNFKDHAMPPPPGTDSHFPFSR